MKYDITLTFYENDSKINFTDIPKNIQTDILQSLKSPKYKTYLEKHLSNNGSACKNNVSHYLKVNIKNIKVSKTNSFFGLFGNTLTLHLSYSVSKVNKKIAGALWCSNELDANGIKELFNEDNIVSHFDNSMKELQRGNPFKYFTFNKKKYYFY